MTARIVQSTGFLFDTFRSAAVGNLVPAAFQRPYVWSKADVEAYWTSLLRGWPTGSFLVWKPKAPAGQRVERARLGPIEMDCDEPRGIILDGQNRLASFAWSLRLPGTPTPSREKLSEAELETWASGDMLVLDPESKSARFHPEGDLGPHSRLLPAGLVFDTRALNSHFRRQSVFIEADLAWLDDVMQVVRDARCTTTVIDGGRPEEALEAFLHICRAGVPMSEQDFRQAMSWAFENDDSAPVHR